MTRKELLTGLVGLMEKYENSVVDKEVKRRGKLAEKTIITQSPSGKLVRRKEKIGRKDVKLNLQDFHDFLKEELKSEA